MWMLACTLNLTTKSRPISLNRFSGLGYLSFKVAGEGETGDIRNFNVLIKLRT